MMNLVGPSSKSNVSPRRILSILHAYREAAALKTAIDLELFTRIAHGSNTVGRIASELGIPSHGLRVLCDYLVQCGLLSNDSDELGLTEEAALFLDKNSPCYQGGSAEILHSPPLLRSFERLTESVRAGASPEPVAVNGLGRPAALSALFSLSRGVLDSRAAAAAFAEAVTLPGDRPIKILDIGAGDGAYGIALAQKYPQAIVVALDSAEALEAAQEHAIRAKLGTRYQNIPGDPLSAPIGFEYDAATTAGCLHRFDPDQISALTLRVHYALKKSGQFIILEGLSGDSSAAGPEFAGFRLTMLAATGRGDVYSLAEVKEALTASGFKSIESQPLPATFATLVTARP
jgi:ubiquinone/menaquinone biosynthesis C-methylase UbiE